MTACNQRLNDCEAKLKGSEEKRKKAKQQRDMVLVVLFVVIAIVAVTSISYRMVPRSLPA